MIHINLIFQYFSVLNRYIPFAMKTILKVYIFSLLTISSCTEESCKTCTSMTSHDGVVQDELNWTAEYCNEELESIENLSPVTSYINDYTIVTEIICD